MSFTIEKQIRERAEAELAKNAVPEKLLMFEPNDYHNGAIFDELNYCWSQTFTEIGKIAGC